MRCPFCIKVCSKCNRLLVAYKGNFAKQEIGKYGLQSRCKECKKKYYEDNKEHIKGYQKQWHQDNKDYSKEYNKRDYVKEYKKKYYENNKERYKECHKQWYKDNLEHIKEYNKQRYEDNPDYWKEYHRRQYQNNSEYHKQHMKKYYEANKEYYKEKSKEQYEKYLEENELERGEGSHGEQLVREVLSNQGIEFTEQYTFNDCKFKYTLRFDFYISSLNTLIEFDGIQHFEIVEHFGGLDTFIITKIRDTIKNEYCKANNINLIRIPYWEFDNIEAILQELL